MQKLERILYAEDEADIQKVTSLALETLGNFTLKICQSGAEAVSEIEGFNPQLLLFDVMMPGLDGPGAFKKIREMEGYSSIPIIFLTAKLDRSAVQTYLAIGAVDVIAKPFDPVTLAKRIETAWQRTQTNQG